MGMGFGFWVLERGLDGDGDGDVMKGIIEERRGKKEGREGV